MPYTRDCYPFPRFENDDQFVGQRSSLKLPYTLPTHLAQTFDPWRRLNSTATLTSARREVYYYDPLAPVDSLDFILKSQYNHHDELFKNRNHTLFQPETIGMEHGRVLKNRVKVIKVEPKPLNHPLEIAEWTKKESIHSVKNAIDGNHTQTTNIGYSRKPDGGFFTT
ncbi:uncharacterized protein C1orf194 homolog [Lingula anatina]|uniref:Uncharacterized protein C1orf194 homolog n=1 Tax=Lingula anatina TaxID=7574 RepID=A0A1S3JNJ5_LINAN|nr:uncharacterized protein C1orf194 homolog [Lingula anatina]|eukprot:XP_013411935.1 uncharacterized protein C1orf194 homolog [Lingula anatina]